VQPQQEVRDAADGRRVVRAVHELALHRSHGVAVAVAARAAGGLVLVLVLAEGLEARAQLAQALAGQRAHGP